MKIEMEILFDTFFGRKHRGLLIICISLRCKVLIQVESTALYYLAQNLKQKQ